MEQSRSVGDHYEFFEGAPEEIASLIKELDSHAQEAPVMIKVKAPKGKEKTFHFCVETEEPSKGGEQ